MAAVPVQTHALLTATHVAVVASHRSGGKAVQALHLQVAAVVLHVQVGADHA